MVYPAQSSTIANDEQGNAIIGLTFLISYTSLLAPRITRYFNLDTQKAPELRRVRVP